MPLPQTVILSHGAPGEIAVPFTGEGNILGTDWRKKYKGTKFAATHSPLLIILTQAVCENWPNLEAPDDPK